MMSKQPGSEGKPLAPLHTLRRLEVGPVRVEPQRLIAPYRVVGGGVEDGSGTDLPLRGGSLHPR